MASDEPTWRWSLSPRSPREWMQRVLLLLLVFVCLLGDFFLWQQVAFSNWSLLRHLVDSGTHFSVGFCCWGIFLCFSHDDRVPPRTWSATDEKTRHSSGSNTTPLPILDEFAPTSSRQSASSSFSSTSSSSLLIPGVRAWRSLLLSCLLAGVTAAILDIDHFIAAGALSIAGATHLKSRPFGHAVPFIVAVTAVVWVVSTKIQRVSKWRRIHRISFVLTTLFSHQFRDGMRLGLWFWPIGSTPGIFYPVYIFLECALPIVLAWWQTTEGRDDGDD